MPVIVTPESQAAQLLIPLPKKVSATNAFAQMMHASPPKTDVANKSGFTIVSPDLSQESTAAEELVSEEDLSEVDNVDELGTVINMLDQQIVDENRALEIGVPTSLPKSNTLNVLPAAFVAQGWRITTPPQQARQLMPVENLGDAVPKDLSDKPKELAATLLSRKLDMPTPTSNLDRSTSIRIGSEDSRPTMQLTPANKSEATLQVTPQTNAVPVLAPEAARQLFTPQAREELEAGKLELNLPRNVHGDTALRTETRSLLNNTPMPLVNNAQMVMDLPTAQTDDVLLEKADFAALGVNERFASAPTAIVDLKSAPPAQIATAVAQQLAVAVHRNPNGVTELVLNPEELGRVRLSMVTQDGALTLTITTERPETQDLMRRHIETLMQELRQMGFHDVGFSFQGQGQHEQSNDSQGSNLKNALIDGEVQQVPAPVTQSSGLDLRL